ncbi:MAG: ABC transporter ATP-binding protein [Atopobiaceae bacterium]|jgi:ABC-type nitrate/sulfonate/bicarbonate transport system ATPase subunit
MDTHAPIAALEARDLSLAWDGEHTVVAGVSLYVNPGEVVCMVGRSGTGKTTILHALAGLTTPMSGEILLHGQPMAGEPGQVSYMFQKDLLLENKSIIDNVSLPLVIKGMSKADARAQAAPLFERFGLKGTENLWPQELSGGMRQRAAFLRTYLMGNDVMLLDEPFSALDAFTRTDMRTWFCEMASQLNIATVAITHDVDEAVSMAHRIYVLAGNPAEGRASTVVAMIESPREKMGVTAADFALTEEFLGCKKEVLSLLGQ